MRFQEFNYEVRAEVEITLAEVELLRELAKAHYDYTCKAAAKEGERLSLDECADVVASEQAAAERGGFLWGWRNQVADPPMLVTMTLRQINLCCKILEMTSHFKPSHPHYEAARALDKAMTVTPPDNIKPLLRMLDDLIGFRESGGTVGSGPILREYENLPARVKAWAFKGSW